MPWLETAPMIERLKFVQDAQSDRFTMAALCARHGVSRKTGYKWIARYAEEGRRGLGDRSRAPHTCPHRLAEATAALLVTARKAHPFWGARKLLAMLQGKHPRILEWPAASTVADLLARQGLVQQRRRRQAATHPGAPRTWKGAAAWSRRLGEGVTTTLGVHASRMRDGYQYVDLNLRDAPSFRLAAEDGRAVWVPAASIPAATGVTDVRNATRVSGYARVLSLASVARAEQRAVTAEVVYRAGGRLSGTIGYAWSRARQFDLWLLPRADGDDVHAGGRRSA